MTDRRPLAAAAVNRALAEGLPPTWKGAFELGGLSIYAAVMDGREPESVLDEWRATHTTAPVDSGERGNWCRYLFRRLRALGRIAP